MPKEKLEDGLLIDGPMQESAFRPVCAAQETSAFGSLAAPETSASHAILPPHHELRDLRDLSGGMKYEIVTVSPSDARVLLERASKNAQIDRRAVNAYAAAMRSNAWVLNGMPLIFSDRGNLLDGFQRLTACVQSDADFETLIVWNVKADTLHTMDQHRRRTFSSVLESRGIRSAGALVRTLSRLIRFESGKVGFPFRQTSWIRFDRVLDANPWIREGVDLSERYSGSPLKATARHCLTAFAIGAGLRNEIHDFLNGLEHGDNVGTGLPAHTLAAQLTVKSRDIDVDEQMALSFMAFDDQIAGRRRNKAYVWKKDYGQVKLARNGQPESRRDFANLAPPNLGMPHPGWLPEVVAARDESENVASNQGVLAGLWRTAHDRAENTADTGVAVSVETVAPERAREWLARHNTRNRNIQDSNIDAMVRDIKNGYWMVNAQPICFAADTGRLLNGQHRLTACVRADAPIDVLIVRGLPDEAFATYDNHMRKLNLSMAQEAANLPIDARVIEAAAILQWREDTYSDVSVSLRPSASELRDTIMKHPDLHVGYGQSRRMGHIASAGVMTYLIYRTTKEDPDLAKEFLHGLETGEHLWKGNPLLKARDLIMQGRHQSYSRQTFMNKLLDIWDNYKNWREKHPTKKGDAPAFDRAGNKG